MKLLQNYRVLWITNSLDSWDIKLKKELNKNGAKIKICSGREIQILPKEIIKVQNPDVIIIDFYIRADDYLNTTDVYWVLNRCKKIARYKNIPLLVISSYLEIKEMKNIKKYGATLLLNIEELSEHEAFNQIVELVLR